MPPLTHSRTIPRKQHEWSEPVSQGTQEDPFAETRAALWRLEGLAAFPSRPAVGLCRAGPQCNPAAEKVLWPCCSLHPNFEDG